MYVQHFSKESERLVKCIFRYLRGQIGYPDTFSAHPCRIYRMSHELSHYFGRVFLMLKYTDITQNTYVQS